MCVEDVGTSEGDAEGRGGVKMVDLSNGWVVSVMAWSIWLFITGLNAVRIYLTGLGFEQCELIFFLWLY